MAYTNTAYIVMADIVMADGVVAFMIGYARVDLSKSPQRSARAPTAAPHGSRPYEPSHLMLVARQKLKTWYSKKSTNTPRGGRRTD